MHAGDDEEAGWEMEDLDIPADAHVPEIASEMAYFVAPNTGVPRSQSWMQNSSLAGEHAAAGSFEIAEPTAWNPELCSFEEHLP